MSAEECNLEITSNKMNCIKCGREITGHGSKRYCSICSPLGVTQSRRKYCAKKRGKVIKNQNGKGKTIIFSYQNYTVVEDAHGITKYLVFNRRNNRKVDIWDSIEDARKRKRVSYFSSFDAAFGFVFEKAVVRHAQVKNYGADLFSLKNAVSNAKRELLEVLSKENNSIYAKLSQTVKSVEKRGD
jgi:hypothetical protein